VKRHVDIDSSPEMRYRFFKYSSGEIVSSSEVSETGAVDQRNVPTVVAEMDRAVDRALDKLLSALPPPWRLRGISDLDGHTCTSPC
jgi:hypothetical protein